MGLAGNPLTLEGFLERVRELRMAEQDARASLPPTPVAAVAPVLCYACGKTGHTRKNCPESAPMASKPSQNSRGPVPVCHFCDQTGHVKKDCPEREQWLKSKALAKDVAAASGDPILCSTDHSTLPRLFVWVKSNHHDLPRRVCGVVDTGSARTLMCHRLATELDLVLQQCERAGLGTSAM